MFFTRAYMVLREALSARDGEVFSSQPAPLARKVDFTRWTMTAIATKVRPLADALALLREALATDRPKVRGTVDVDPYDFG